MGLPRARIPEWVAISFSGVSSWSRDWICVSCIAGGTWKTRIGEFKPKSPLLPPTALHPSFPQGQGGRELPKQSLKPVTPSFPRPKLRTSQVAQRVENLPAVQETRVWSLGWEDPLEKAMATQPSILAWEIPWTEEPGGLQSLKLRQSLMMGLGGRVDSQEWEGPDGAEEGSVYPLL